MLKRTNIFKVFLLLILLGGMLAVTGIEPCIAGTLSNGVSASLNGDPRHCSYPGDSDYGKAEYIYDTLTIAGSGMQQGEQIYSVKDIENLYEDAQFGCDVTYSITGSEGLYKTWTLSGVRLYELLVRAGMDTALPDSTKVTIMAKDGYNSIHNLGEIRNTEQYNYYNEAGESLAGNLPVMVAFASNGCPLVGPIGSQDWFDSGIAGLSEENANGGGPLKIIFAQTAPGSNNAQYNNKLLTRIIIGDDVKSTQHNRDPYSRYGTSQFLVKLIDSATSEILNSKTYTVNEIEAMVNTSKTALVRNYYPDNDANYYEGIDIYYLLAENFGLTGNEGEFSIIDAGGRESNHINLDYLLNPGKDYSSYYTTKEGKLISWVKPVLAFAQNSEPLQDDGPLLAAFPQHDTYLSQGLVQACTGINVYIVQDTCTHTTEPFSQWKDDQITFTGDGLNTSREYKVENLEQFLELVKEDNFTVGSETAAYRGINLYSLLTSGRLGLKMATDRIEVSSRNGSMVSFTLDELQNSDLKVMLAYGKNGKPLVPSGQDAGYDDGAANGGGPLYLAINGDEGRCLEQVVQVKVIAQQTESWKHDREAPYDSFLDTTFLRICGSAMEQPKVYSLHELEAMDEGIVREYLAASEVMGYYEGLDLKYLLQAAGFSSEPAKITVCSPNDDGTVFAKQLAVEDVWSGISSTTQNGAIKPVVLAYAKDGYPLVNSLDPAAGYVAAADNGYGPLRLVVENSKPLCVKYVAGIIVGDGTPVSYTVNYLDQDGQKTIAAAKASVGIDGENIAAAAEEIDIAGYVFSKAEKDNLSLSAGDMDKNVINLYYEKEDEQTDITDIGLVVSGSGLPKLMYLTMDELKSIAAGKHATIENEFRTFSVLARGGVKTMISTSGIDLGALLQQAGVGTESYVISTISSDANRVDLNYNGTSKSFEPQCYYYPDILPGDNGESGPIDPILALYRAESNEEDSNPHMPTREELIEVEQFPLPTLTIGQTNKDDYNNQFNNKYVQQVIVGKKDGNVFSISGTGMAKKLSYTIPDLMLKGMEKTTLKGKTCTGISLPRLLEAVNDLDDNALTSFITGTSGGVSIYYNDGLIEHVTELLIGTQDSDTRMLKDLKNPANQYFLAYNTEAKTTTKPSDDDATLILRPIYLAAEKKAEEKPVDLLALQDKPYVNMESYLTKAVDDGTEKDTIVLKAEARQAIQEAENGAVLLFSTSQEDTGVVLEISKEMLGQIQDKDMYLQVNIAQGAYVIQADALDMSGIAGDVGKQDYVLQIKMNEVSEEQLQIIKSSLPADYTLQGTPLSTEIICKAGEKQIKLSSLSAYIYRDLLLSEKVSPEKCTVLCWDDDNDMPRAVPAVFMERNGQIYARSFSCSNSVYAVVAGSKTFTDMQNQEAGNDVEILASKLILSGKNGREFDPNGGVSRAELAALLVRALGLKVLSGQEICFSDVNGEERLADSIATAAKAKIINGLPDGSFQPQRNVTRQEAMVMLANALQMAGVKFDLNDQEYDELISEFRDYHEIDWWACPAVAVAVKSGVISSKADFVAQHQLNRAESAALVMGLLKAAGLIDVRTTLSALHADSETKTSESNSNIGEEDKGILVVEGAALTQKKLYSLDDLKAMAAIIVNDSYFSRGKAKDNWAAEQHDNFTGVSLYRLLLDKIGLKTRPMEIKIIGADDFTKIFSIDEATGLYIDETRPDARLEMIITWAQNGMQYQSDQPFRIVMGQKYEGDFNRQNWVNNVKRIVVY
ncbi:MAG: S-layer homology domain-containing protein [Syntrophomonas sp.]